MAVDDRESFEKWARRKKYITAMVATIPPKYHEGDTQCVWEAWQARGEHDAAELVSITTHPQWPLVAKEQWEAEQVLGRALCYPWYKDDTKNFPDASEADGVCTGEHTLVTIAMEAATELAEAKRRVVEMNKALWYISINCLPLGDDWCEVPSKVANYARQALSNNKGGE